MHNLHTYLSVNVISIRYHLYMVHKNLHNGIKNQNEKDKIKQFNNDCNFQPAELVYICSLTIVCIKLNMPPFNRQHTLYLYIYTIL
jgi:predicted transcriptional regulator